jgi:hypothetical protein
MVKKFSHTQMKKSPPQTYFSPNKEPNLHTRLLERDYLAYKSTMKWTI